MTAPRAEKRKPSLTVRVLRAVEEAELPIPTRELVERVRVAA